MTKVLAGLRRRDGLSQIAVVLAALGAYELARLVMEPDWAAATANARRITHVEELLSLGWERPLQDAFLAVPDIVRAMNVFYFVGHFVLTGLFFLWLYHRSRTGFRLFRDGFLFATLIAVVIHWKFPTAPPRIADPAILDTLRLFSGIDIGSPDSTALSNPVAAVPSLHAGYALGVGIGVFRYARSVFVRSAGLGYPALVVLTIIVTGNHFVLDAIAGIAVLGLGFVLAPRLVRMRGRGAILASAPRGGAVR
ncbi:MAG: phosphatase PAP2 family protein [Gaiellaceae bacterium]